MSTLITVRPYRWDRLAPRRDAAVLSTAKRIAAVGRPSDGGQREDGRRPACKCAAGSVSAHDHLSMKGSGKYYDHTGTTSGCRGCGWRRRPADVARRVPTARDCGAHGRSTSAQARGRGGVRARAAGGTSVQNIVPAYDARVWSRPA